MRPLGIVLAPIIAVLAFALPPSPARSANELRIIDDSSKGVRVALPLDDPRPPSAGSRFGISRPERFGSISAGMSTALERLRFRRTIVGSSPPVTMVQFDIGLEPAGGGPRSTRLHETVVG